MTDGGVVQRDLTELQDSFDALQRNYEGLLHDHGALQELTRTQEEHIRSLHARTAELSNRSTRSPSPTQGACAVVAVFLYVVGFWATSSCSLQITHPLLDLCGGYQAKPFRNIPRDPVVWLCY